MTRRSLLKGLMVLPLAPLLGSEKLQTISVKEFAGGIPNYTSNVRNNVVRVTASDVVQCQSDMEKRINEFYTKEVLQVFYRKG